MEISVIASGSNGNCCLVEDKGTAIIVDAGKPGKEIARRMAALGRRMEDVSAILITHRHTDHTRGAGALSRRFSIPVYMTKETSESMAVNASKCVSFSISREFSVGSIRVKPIATSHNVNSCGFMFNGRLAVITDTGCATRQMEDAVSKAKAVLLESNHDIDMLIKGRYPYFLKQWILSNEGHLSNIDASSLIQSRANELSLAILGHLSGNNNTPEIALATFQALVKKKIDVAVALRDKETGTFHV